MSTGENELSDDRQDIDVSMRIPIVSHARPTHLMSHHVNVSCPSLLDKQQPNKRAGARFQLNPERLVETFSWCEM